MNIKFAEVCFRFFASLSCIYVIMSLHVSLSRGEKHPVQLTTQAVRGVFVWVAGVKGEELEEGRGSCRWESTLRVGNPTKGKGRMGILFWKLLCFSNQAISTIIRQSC